MRSGREARLGRRRPLTTTPNGLFQGGYHSNPGPYGVKTITFNIMVPTITLGFAYGTTYRIHIATNDYYMNTGGGLERFILVRDHHDLHPQRGCFVAAQAGGSAPPRTAS